MGSVQIISDLVRDSIVFLAESSVSRTVFRAKFLVTWSPVGLSRMIAMSLPIFSSNLAISSGSTSTEPNSKNLVSAGVGHYRSIESNYLVYSFVRLILKSLECGVGIRHYGLESHSPDFGARNELSNRMNNRKKCRGFKFGSLCFERSDSPGKISSLELE